MLRIVLGCYQSYVFPYVLFGFCHLSRQGLDVNQFHNATLLFIDFGELYLTEEELEWLGRACPYFAQDYLDYLKGLRFKPEQVKVTFSPQPDNKDLGRLEIEATGPWVETILWEVPLMAVLSELHFTTGDIDWNYDGQEGKTSFTTFRPIP